jgi:lambda family phage tail tape measure protein
MSDTVGAAQLAITADASGVEAGVSKAKKTLATLGGAAKAAGKEAAEGLDKMGAGGEQASQKVDRATKNMIASIQRTTATMEAGSRSSSKFFETLATQRGVDVNVLRPYLQQLDAASTKQVAAANAARAIAPAITQVGLSARQTAFALRGVPAQFTDIATSLAAGQNPLQVFLQQGGQLKDMFGGLGPAARALGGYVMGLVTPLTVAAGAVALLGLAYFQGSKEGDNFAKAIILSGNAAGKTVGELQQMAERISAVSGTQSAAAEALTMFVSNGQIAGDSVERFTAIALKMEKLTGQAVDETVKQFAELGKSPVEASAKLNEATNFLTAGVARQIRMLEEQGRVVEAGTLAQNTWADAMETRLPRVETRLGYLERAARATGAAFKWMWDQALNIGRPDTITDLERQIAVIEGAAIGAQRRADPTLSASDAAAVKSLKDRISALREADKFDRRAAEYQAASAAQSRAQLAFDKAGDQFLSKKARMEREITEARNLGAQAGLKQEEIEKRIAAIREKYTDKGAGKSAAAEARRMGRAGLGLDIEQIKAESEKLIAVYSQSERKLESLRSAGLLSDEEYYDGKRRLITVASEAEEADLQKRIARLQAEKLAGADKLKNDEKIVDLQAKLAILRADTSAKLEEQSDKQVQATDREAASFYEARTAAEQYLNALSRAQERGLGGIGRGRKQRDIDGGRFAIEDKYGAQRDRLTLDREVTRLAQGGLNADQRRFFEDRLALVDEMQARELAKYDSFTQRRLGMEQDWLSGAQEALRNYADEAGNVASQTEDFFGRAFSSLEDSITQFVATGKLDFKGLVTSILADLARLEARKLTGAIASALSNALSGIGGISGTASGPDWDIATSGMSLDGRAIGGPVSAGRTYRVNERNTPELLNVGGKQFLMMGNQGGKVTPGGGTQQTVHQNIMVGDFVNRATMRREMEAAQRAAMAKLQRSSVYGGGD